ncbi:hypothetical protein SMD44_p10114 (plasmid) [Streptomyces alboflavus]|uniref:Uncharacterized protein n=1 Tax=Streptomyces alboflavus TaxID=67267 RepID=A0A291W3Y3_9ACTN|nr:hypothetical protein [Streptomyces alboflavus]ATM24613.1 hypothetical protein SMD44_p10114 [Streptomyces alboflavus]
MSTDQLLEQFRTRPASPTAGPGGAILYLALAVRGPEVFPEGGSARPVFEQAAALPYTGRTGRRTW